MSNYLGRDLENAIKSVSENKLDKLKVNRVRAARDDLNDILKRRVPPSDHDKVKYLDLLLSYAEQGKWTDVNTLKLRGIEEYNEVLKYLDGSYSPTVNAPDTSRSLRDPKQMRQDILTVIKGEMVRNTPTPRHETNKRQTRGDPALEDAMVKMEEEIAELKEKLNQVVAEKAEEEEVEHDKPFRLAQTFKSIYEHEWAEAFESLKSTFKTDEKIIRTLSLYLRMAFDYSAEMEKQQILNITQSILCPDGRTFNKAKVSVEVYSAAEKKAKDLQKESIDLSIHSLGEGFLIKNKSLLHDNDKFRKYIVKCVELAWLFHFEKPAPFPLWEIDGTDTKEYLRPFTHEGKRIRCQVWPTLLLQENGPVISDGVVLYY